MWRDLSDWLYRVVSGWWVLTSAAFFLAFVIFVLPYLASAILTRDPDLGTPDLSFLYSAEDLYRMADAYGVNGRREYVKSSLTLDTVWPLVYVSFLALSITWVYRQASMAGSALSMVGSALRRANVTPVAAGLLDLLENAAASLVFLRYPTRTPGLDSLTPVLTMSKWVLVAGSVTLLLVGIIIWLWRWAARRFKGFDAHF